MDLTSREGEWFLDDMCLISGMMTRISSLIQAPTPDALQCIMPIYKLFCALQVRPSLYFVTKHKLKGIN